LTPFRWRPPRAFPNHAQVTDRGHLRFAAPGMVLLAGRADWIDRASLRNEFTLRLRARAFSSAQRGPARLFSISANPSLRNLTVAQSRSDLVLRLRTPATTLNGTPEYVVEGVFETSSWREVEISVAGSSLNVSVDGRPRLPAVLPVEPLRTWNPRMRVVFGNERSGNRAWLGEISEAILWVADRRIDLLKDVDLDVPPRLWPGVSSAPFFHPMESIRARLDLRDMVLNLLFFVPLGFILPLLRPRRGSVLFAIGFCALVSLGGELAQVYFAFRIPSVLDWAMNVVGATLGACLSGMLLQLGSRTFSIGGHGA